MRMNLRDSLRIGPHRTALLIAGAVTFAMITPGVARAADNYEVVVERSVGAKMRDGVTLRADIYRPKADGKFPVLLVRTPYDKTGETGFGLKAAARGYVVIAQDVRGRFESEGEWYPFKNESQDGYDTVEWAAALPYSNGKVGMFGGSYVGATQYLAAIAQPPHLAGICPTVTASNYHDGWTYQGGAFEQWFNESWTHGTGAEHDAAARGQRQRRAGRDAKCCRWRRIRCCEAPSAAGLAPYFTDWLAHPNFDEYWKQWSIEDHYSQIQVPVLQLGRVVRHFSGRDAEELRAAEDGSGNGSCATRAAAGGLRGRARGRIEHWKSRRGGFWREAAVRCGRGRCCAGTTGC